MTCKNEGAKLTKTPGILELPYDPAISLLGTHPEDLKAGTPANVHTLMSIAALLAIAGRWNRPLFTDRWTSRRNGVCPHYGVLLSFRKGGDSGTRYHVLELGGHHAECHTRTVGFHLYAVPEVVRFRDRKWERGFPGWGVRVEWGQGLFWG